MYGEAVASVMINKKGGGDPKKVMPEHLKYITIAPPRLDPKVNERRAVRRPNNSFDGVLTMLPTDSLAATNLAPKVKAAAAAAVEIRNQELANINTLVEESDDKISESSPESPDDDTVEVDSENDSEAEKDARSDNLSSEREENADETLRSRSSAFLYMHNRDTAQHTSERDAEESKSGQDDEESKSDYVDEESKSLSRSGSYHSENSHQDDHESESSRHSDHPSGETCDQDAQNDQASAHSDHSSRHSEQPQENLTATLRSVRSVSFIDDHIEELSIPVTSSLSPTRMMSEAKLDNLFANTQQSLLDEINADYLDQKANSVI